MSISGVDTKERTISLVIYRYYFPTKLAINFESEEMAQAFIERLREINPSESSIEHMGVDHNKLIMPYLPGDGEKPYLLKFENTDVAKEFSKLIFQAECTGGCIYFNIKRPHVPLGQFPVSRELAKLTDEYVKRIPRKIAISHSRFKLKISFESPTMRRVFIKELEDADRFALIENQIVLEDERSIRLQSKAETFYPYSHYLDFTLIEVANRFAQLIYSKPASLFRIPLAHLQEDFIEVSKELAHLTDAAQAAELMGTVPQLRMLMATAPQPSYMPAYEGKKAPSPVVVTPRPGKLTLYKTEKNELAIRFQSAELRDQFIKHVFNEDGRLVRTYEDKDKILYIPCSMVDGILLKTQFNDKEQMQKFYDAILLNKDTQDALLREDESAIYFQGAILEEGENIHTDLSQDFIAAVIHSTNPKLK